MRLAHYVAFIILPAVFLCSCQLYKPQEEKIFKDSIEKLTAIMEAVPKAGHGPKTEKTENGMITSWDRDAQIVLLTNQKDRIQEIEKNLNIIVDQHPESKWADDAAFCQSLLYEKVFWWFQEVFPDKNNYVKDFVRNFNDFSIEKWTKNELGPFYTMFIESPLGNCNISNENEIVKYRLIIHISLEHCTNGEYQKAKEVAEYLRLNGFPEGCTTDLLGLIQVYKENFAGGPSAP